EGWTSPMKPAAKILAGVVLMMAVLHVRGLSDALAASVGSRTDLPNFDLRRQAGSVVAATDADRAAALAKLKSLVPDVKVDYDDVVGSPSWIIAPHGFLTGPAGGGAAIAAGTLARFSPTD